MTKDQKATRALGNRLAGLGIAVGYRHNDDGELEIRVCMAAAKKIAALLDRLSATAPELETIGTKPATTSGALLVELAILATDPRLHVRARKRMARTAVEPSFEGGPVAAIDYALGLNAERRPESRQRVGDDLVNLSVAFASARKAS